jgi:hypothetical protein
VRYLPRIALPLAGEAPLGIPANASEAADADAPLRNCRLVQRSLNLFLSYPVLDHNPESWEPVEAQFYMLRRHTIAIMNS